MKKSMFVLVVLVFTSASVFAAGVDLTGVGVRSTNLGGNYRAVSNDWSGMFWNPAGLVFSKGLKVGGSLEFIKPVSSYLPAKSLANQQFSGTGTTAIENEPKTFLMPAFGIYYSTEKYAVGLGFWAPFGLGAKWDLLNTSAYNSAYPQFEFEDDLKVMALQPTFAVKLKNNLSLGLGVTLLYADIMIRKPNFTPNPYIYDNNLRSAAAALLPAAALTSPNDHLLTESLLNGDGMGFGLNAGLQWKPVPTLTLGLSTRYYNTIALDGTVSATTYFATNLAAHQQIDKSFKPIIMARTDLDAASKAALINFYSGATYPRYPEMDVKADMPLPLNVGAGFAFTGIKNLLITGDVAMTQWSAWDVIEVKDTDGKLINQLTQNWEDGIRMGVGMEYDLGLLKARLSFYSEPRAAINETMTITIPDVNRRNVGIVGLGIPVGPATIGIMYERMFISDLTVDSWVLDATKSGYDNMAGDYTMSVNNFMIGLDFNF